MQTSIVTRGRPCAVPSRTRASASSPRGGLIARSQPDRRTLISTGLLSTALLLVQQDEAHAYTGLDYKQEIARRRKKIPEDAFSDGPEGLKFYDIITGTGMEAKEGQRVAVHYDVKFRNVTFITSRQGMGVTGGTPVGFNVGAPSGSAGSTLPGIDLGIRGMRVGGLRRLLVPPELAYGTKGVGEIPPNATLTVDVELLSIKSGPLGYRTKLVEG